MLDAKLSASTPWQLLAALMSLCRAADMSTMRVPFRNLKPARKGRIVRAPIALVVALAAAASLGACGSSSSSTTVPPSLPASILNTNTVEQAIEESILEQRHTPAKVTCPSVVPQEKGRNFACIATVGDTKTAFVVTQTNDSGHVTYHAK
jgi:Domain of unknown function (DUF4333)